MFKTKNFFFLKRRCIDLRQYLFVNISKHYKKRSLSKISRIVIHASDRDWTISQLNEYDVTGQLTYMYNGKLTTDINHISSSGLPAITYHLCIDKKGLISQTLSAKEVSWHAAGYNTNSLAVCLLYRVTNPVTHKAEYGPNKVMISSLRDVLVEACLQYHLTPNRIKGHRELFGTGFFIDKSGKQRLRKSCPGKKINLNELRSDVAYLMQQELKDRGYYEGRLDAQFGRKSKKAFNKFINSKENT